MIRRLLAAASLLLALAPAGASARSLAREGTVAILPGARFANHGAGIEGQAAPGMGLAFGFKPSAALEVGIDFGASYSEVQGRGSDWKLLAAPLLLRVTWTPLPALDVRPVVTGGVGKALLTVDGPSYREHTPSAFLATVGLQADVSKRMGLMADVGYLHARAEDPTLGRLDGGGLLARAGIYFRWDPVPERRF